MFAETKSSETAAKTTQSKSAKHPAVEKALKYIDEENYEKAFEYLSIAAKDGDAEAQTILGWMYDQGKDYTKALRYYKLAADQGDVVAQNNLGVMYNQGKGVTQDHKVAARYYKLAADQGYAEAQYNLGFMYYQGSGVKQDKNEAMRYYKLAASQGLEEAKRALKKIFAQKEELKKDEIKTKDDFLLQEKEARDLTEKATALTLMFLAVLYWGVLICLVIWVVKTSKIQESISEYPKGIGGWLGWFCLVFFEREC